MFAKRATALFIGGAALAGGSVAFAEGYKDAHTAAGEWRLPRPHYEVLVSFLFTIACLAVSLYVYVPKLLVPKIGNILKNYFFPAAVKLPEWEEDIASRPGLRLQSEVSRLAQSSTDGALLMCMPRVSEAAACSRIDDARCPRSTSLSCRTVRSRRRKTRRTTWFAPLPRSWIVPLSACRATHQGTCTAPGTLEKTRYYHLFLLQQTGHPDIVHGGALATAIDESCGHAFMALGRGLGFTAYLHVNYKKPTPAGIPLLVILLPLQLLLAHSCLLLLSCLPPVSSAPLSLCTSLFSPLDVSDHCQAQEHRGEEGDAGGRCQRREANVSGTVSVSKCLTSLRDTREFADGSALFVVPRKKE
eukprot:766457-Hanusia_phi.AAC.1